MIVVNLQHIAPVAPMQVTPAVLQEVLSTAEDLLATTPEEVMDEILEEWAIGLAWAAVTDSVPNSDWYLRALLLTCCRGLRGESAPKFYFIGSAD